MFKTATDERTIQDHRSPAEKAELVVQKFSRPRASLMGKGNSAQIKVENNAIAKR
jgi:hypothetical protein